MAVCNLDQFLDDCELLYHPIRLGMHEISDIRKRLVALGIPGNSPIKELNQGPDGLIHERLHEIMGCITNAMIFMHKSGIEHRHLSPRCSSWTRASVHYRLRHFSRSRICYTNDHRNGLRPHKRLCRPRDNEPRCSESQTSRRLLFGVRFPPHVVRDVGVDERAPVQTRGECSRVLSNPPRRPKDIEDFFGASKKDRNCAWDG